MSTMQATIGPIAGLLAPNRSNAQSDDARRLLELQEEIREHLLTSYTVRADRERLLKDLDELWAETSRPGWDGYGALPMSPDAFDFAKTFIKALPTTAPLPELSADPDGEVSLDWSFGDRRVLSVSIGPTGRCTFAWLLGQRSNRGTDWIEDEIPAPIAFALRELAPADVSPGAK
jgi:hypothetical protein